MAKVAGDTGRTPDGLSDRVTQNQASIAQA
jgi:hypothetical protein